MNIVKPASLFGVNPSHPVDRAHPLNRGMVGWWLALPHLVGGNTVYDLGGKWHGTFYTDNASRPSWVGASRPGGYAATHMDGTNSQHIALPSGLSGAFTASEATFACWILKLPASAGYSTAGLANLGPTSQVSVWGGNGGNCYFSVFEQSIRPIGPVVPPNQNSWNHVVVTSKAGTGNYRLLINGKLYATGDQNLFGLPSDPNFGGASTANLETMLGSADDWRLWNRALSDAEIEQLYQESRAGYPTMLVRRPLYWSVSGSQAFSFLPAGGVDLGGSPAASAGFAAAPHGGSDLGGSAGPTLSAGFAPSGGADLGGAAGPTFAYAPAPAGGVALGGASGPILAAAFAPSGGVEFGGAADLTGSISYSFSPSGGVEFGGSPAATTTFAPSPAGGVALGGAADVAGSTAYAFTPSGGLSLGGSAPAASAWIVDPAGGIDLGGAADLAGAHVYTFDPSGGVVFGGSRRTWYDGATVPAALQVWWADRPELAALVGGGGLWHVEAPEGVDPPYATFFTVAETERDGRTTGYAVIDSTIQLSAHGRTDVEAEAIRKAIRKAIKGAPLAIDGRPAWYCLPGGQTLSVGEGFGPGGADCWIATVDVEIPWQTDQDD